MPRVADFITRADGGFTLSGGPGGDIDNTIDISLASGAALGSPSVLMFKIRVTGTGTNQFTVRLNGTSVVTRSFTAMQRTTYHEQIAANVLTAGGNRLEFVLTSGTGNVIISDVVLFYRRDI